MNVYVYCVQEFMDGNVWRTFYVSSIEDEAREALMTAIRFPDAGPMRLVVFAVDDFDFIGSYGRDFEVLTKIG